MPYPYNSMASGYFPELEGQNAMGPMPEVQVPQPKSFTVGGQEYLIIEDPAQLERLRNISMSEHWKNSEGKRWETAKNLGKVGANFMLDMLHTPLSDIKAAQEAITGNVLLHEGVPGAESKLGPAERIAAGIGALPFVPNMAGAVKGVLKPASYILDKQTAKLLDSKPTVKVFRAMQLIDGKLYPPMSAKVGGELRNPTEIGVWEKAVEQPELADETGHFVLNKGNQKSIKARYNPYFHTSPSPLNDQFSEAYKRPNLVTVEVEIPKDELISGYKAEKAKDSVGEKPWHSGPVSSKLPSNKKRTIILSRYAKVTRIVPDSEVAEHISNIFKGEDIVIPENVVTPSLREELIKRGIQVSNPISAGAVKNVGKAAKNE